MEFNLEQAVNRRYSVRTFTNERVPADVRKKINDCISLLSNPFGPSARFVLLDRDAPKGGEKIGTYGIIKNATLFLCGVIGDDPHAMEAYGYEFESLVLRLTSMGLGTCILGGTFNKGEFAKAIDLKENELFPCVSPVGHPAAKKSLVERVMRTGVKADSRLPWTELFFVEDFGKPLSRAEAGPYAYAFDLLRLAPSAVNKQPWRVVKQGNAFHFYEQKSADPEGKIDMQRIDLGIAMCHFAFACEDKALPGRFVTKDPGLPVPPHTFYISSFVCED